MRSTAKKKESPLEALSSTSEKDKTLSKLEIYEGYLKQFLLLEEKIRKEELALIAKLDKEYKGLKISDLSELQEYKEASLRRTLKYSHLVFQNILESFLTEIKDKEDTCIISDLKTFYSHNSNQKII